MTPTNIAWLSGFISLMVLEVGEKLLFRDRTAFWWFFSVNFVIGYFALSLYAVCLYLLGKERDRKDVLAWNLALSALFASLWLGIALMAYADHIDSKRLQARRIN